MHPELLAVAAISSYPHSRFCFLIYQAHVMHQAVKIVEWANLINANTIKYPGMEKGKQIREIFFEKV